MWIIFSLLNAFFESLKDVQSKRNLKHADEYTVAWAMNMIAGILLAAAVAVTGVPEITPRFWTALGVSGVLNIAAAVLYMKALRWADLSLTVPLLAFTPVFLLVTSPFMVNEYPTLFGLIGVCLVVIGSYLLNIGEFREGWLAPFQALVRNRGSRSMLLIAVLWGVTANFDKIGLQASSPLFWAASFHSFLGLSLLPFMAFRNRLKSLQSFWASLASVGIAKALSSGFQMMAMSLTLVPYAISVKRTSGLMGVLWGHFHFKEQGARQRLLGAAIMVAGVILITIS